MPVTEGGKALSTFLLLVVLPPGGSLTRRTIKRLGDINVGFATQCLMVIKHTILSNFINNQLMLPCVHQPDQVAKASSAYILNVVLK